MLFILATVDGRNNRLGRGQRPFYGLARSGPGLGSASIVSGEYSRVLFTVCTVQPGTVVTLASSSGILESRKTCTTQLQKTLSRNRCQENPYPQYPNDYRNLYLRHGTVWSMTQWLAKKVRIKKSPVQRQPALVDNQTALHPNVRAYFRVARE